MANPTTNFGWVMPTATDLVTDLPADFAVFGQGVDTSMAGLLGGTTGQVLSKTSGTNMAFTWVTAQVGDITAVTTTAPLQGGSTSGAVALTVDAASTSASGVVQLSNSTSTTSSVLAATPTAVKAAYDLADAAIAKTTVTTAGDIIYRNATVPTRLGIGTAGQVLTVNSGATAPQWSTAASGSTFAGCVVYNSASQSISNDSATIINWNTERIDTDAFHSTSSNTSRITIPSGKAGKYLIQANCTWGYSITNTKLLRLQINGTTRIAEYAGFPYYPSGNDSTCTLSTVYDLIVGDYIEVQVYQNSGGALDVQSPVATTGLRSFFSAYLIGA